MASSTLEKLRDQMVTDLETTDIVSARKDFPASFTQYPVAIITFGDVEYDLDIDQTIDGVVDVFVSIYGETRDKVDVISAAVAKLWLDRGAGSKFQGLVDLGVINIFPTGSDTAVDFGSDTKAFGGVTLEMTYRETYT